MGSERMLVRARRVAAATWLPAVLWLCCAVAVLPARPNPLRGFYVAQERSGECSLAVGRSNTVGGSMGRCGSMWDHLDRYPLRGLVVGQERPGTLGGGLDVVPVRGEAAQ